MTTNNPLSWAHPLVHDWFISQFNQPTAPQIQGWPAILAGQSTLISASTGSGKTFAAFLACIDYLVRQALAGDLKDQTEVVYISPLKALSNDIQINLMSPLTAIAALAKKRGLKMAEIRVAVRTGDTLAKDRQKMLKKPPHILVTTPESFYILLTAEKSRANLTRVKTVIVDEIHALVNDKRGAHLALSLERLEAISQNSPVRIGLSATQKPIETVAQFLVGSQRAKPSIVNIGHARQLDIAVEVPKSELSAVATNEMWDEIYLRLAELAQQNRSTLVFVNTRRLAERVAHHLAEHLGEEQVAAHHGSLSRKIRLNAETKLKNGELKVLVATASLELGIDIGFIDLVCQLGSPRGIAVALQRIGRAGHWYGATSKGRIFATTRDELLECAALTYAIRQGDLDQLLIPEEPIDILAQQIVATCATGDWREEDLFNLVKQAYPYRNLARKTFNSVLEMLAEGIAGSRSRYSAYLFRDQVNGIVKARRGSRLIAITSGGAIPDNGLFTVIAEPDDVMVGTLDEDFAVESNRGDIILLGTTSWKVNRIESAAGRVIVENAHGAPPSVPFWRGEAPARTDELSLQVSDLRDTLAAQEKSSAMRWLKSECGLNDFAAQQLVDYIAEGKKVLGAVPTQKTVIAERFFDESGGMQLIIHAPFGSRINKAWGLALRKRFCRSFNFELQAAATENGLNIALAEQHSFPLADVFQFLHPNTIADVLTQAVLQSPLFTTRWRWDATRALALIRFRNGKKIPPNIQRMLSDDLLAAVFPDAAACQDNLAGEDIVLPSHPLIDETMKDIFTEALDLAGLTRVLEDIGAGKITCLAVDTPLPSAFSHEILNANPYAFLDDAPLEERRARAVEMRRILPDNLQEAGKLSPAAITEVKQQIWPDLRNADELHDFLQTVIAFPYEQNTQSLWKIFSETLLQDKRMLIVNYKNKIFWLAAEKTRIFSAIYPDAVLQHTVAQKELSQAEAILLMLRGWLSYTGPITVQELSSLLAVAPNEIAQAMLMLESSGFVLRGNFTDNKNNVIEWCERRILARIHRLTLTQLRKEIEPVTPLIFMHWLLTWQHLTPGTQLSGEQGLLEIIRQLQGFELAANAWETQIFASRIKNYDSSLLDRLCLTGVVGWGRLSSHPHTLEDSDGKRISPTSISPVTFFMRETSDWMPQDERTELIGVSHAAKKIYAFLQQRGASFFTDIVNGVDSLRSEIETGLWELVVAGFITADSFDNLRMLMNSQRRLRKKGRRKIFPRNSMGRWALLYRHQTVERERHIEAVCWMLLHRYGVIFRDLLAREKNIPRWHELLPALRRLESRGEIRGGCFVAGFVGEQFALPYAVESLRALKAKAPVLQTLTLSAVDPLNLSGIILPGARVAAISGNTLVVPYSMS